MTEALAGLGGATLALGKESQLLSEHASKMTTMTNFGVRPQLNAESDTVAAVRAVRASREMSLLRAKRIVDALIEEEIATFFMQGIATEEEAHKIATFFRDEGIVAEVVTSESSLPMIVDVSEKT